MSKIVTTLTALGALVAVALGPPTFSQPSAAADSGSNCYGFRPTIVGTAGPDVLRGTPGRDVIIGLGGNDKIFGRQRQDRICGGPGADVIHAGPGYDSAGGGDGNDTLYGDAGIESIDGGSGADVLISGQDGGRANGGPGNDRLIGSRWRDEFDGGPGDDVLRGSSGKQGAPQVGFDLLVGGGGNDTLVGPPNKRAKAQVSGASVTVRGGTATATNGDRTTMRRVSNLGLSVGDDTVIDPLPTIHGIRTGPGDDVVTQTAPTNIPLVVNSGRGDDSVQVNNAGSTKVNLGRGDDRYRESGTTLSTQVTIFKAGGTVDLDGNDSPHVATFGVYDDGSTSPKGVGGSVSFGGGSDTAKLRVPSSPDLSIALGAGNDSVRNVEAVGTISGEAGRDSLTASPDDRFEKAWIDLATGEHRNFAFAGLSGFENFGIIAPDTGPLVTVRGTDGPNRIDFHDSERRLIAYALGGDDVVIGSTRPDTLDGGDGTDTADGEGGDNTCIAFETVTNCEVP